MHLSQFIIFIVEKKKKKILVNKHGKLFIKIVFIFIHLAVQSS